MSKTPLTRAQKRVYFPNSKPLLSDKQIKEVMEQARRDQVIAQQMQMKVVGEAK